MKTLALAQARGESINEDSPTDQLIAWTFERFANQRLVITTSFGMEGCVVIDMFAAHAKPITVIYLDTMFFYEETYRLRDRLVERYAHFDFVNCGTRLTPQDQETLHGPELWKTDPDLCCKLRKVEPMREALAGVDVWITGLSRFQSVTRQNLRVIEWDWKYQLLKISPLANWNRERVWEYVKKNNVPYNELHEQGYPSIGCTHCTVPVTGLSVGEYSRAGRWNGKAKTECGLHGDGI